MVVYIYLEKTFESNTPTIKDVYALLAGRRAYISLVTKPLELPREVLEIEYFADTGTGHEYLRANSVGNILKPQNYDKTKILRKPIIDWNVKPRNFCIRLGDDIALEEKFKSDNFVACGSRTYRESIYKMLLHSLENFDGKREQGNAEILSSLAEGLGFDFKIEEFKKDRDEVVGFLKAKNKSEIYGVGLPVDAYMITTVGDATHQLKGTTYIVHKVIDISGADGGAIYNAYSQKGEELLAVFIPDSKIVDKLHLNRLEPIR